MEQIGLGVIRSARARARNHFTDASKMIYLTNFIVDIPSISQSYVVTNYYSPLSPEISGLTDYTTLVTCPDSSQLIYGDFNCIDRFVWENQGL